MNDAFVYFIKNQKKANSWHLFLFRKVYPSYLYDSDTSTCSTLSSNYSSISKPYQTPIYFGKYGKKSNFYEQCRKDGYRRDTLHSKYFGLRYDYPSRHAFAKQPSFRNYLPYQGKYFSKPIGSSRHKNSDRNFDFRRKMKFFLTQKTSSNKKFFSYFVPSMLFNKRNRPIRQLHSNYNSSGANNWFLNNDSRRRNVSSTNSDMWKLSRSFYSDSFGNERVFTYGSPQKYNNSSTKRDFPDVKPFLPIRWDSDSMKVVNAKSGDYRNHAIHGRSSRRSKETYKLPMYKFASSSSNLSDSATHSSDDSKEAFVRNFSYRYKAFSRK